eukprot:CAMPEP_0204867198 /NCGR_PEP_ID=MMETSP1348-20121228/21266_1 /ASSEMBLY_ACC=CAM_ASM_000700 /TAXON_ID=215587 /ORGANISM="Aplanochytrium stocchinoi, Strain GSBS06" /LENGTH=113 /DNA_ID=CAMNT_0052019477 /DNA_START=85 /DNA_END=423 /DNA_ORIENTATION=-
MDELSNLGKAITKTSDEAAAQNNYTQMKPKLDEFITMMGEHLKEEEEVTPEILRKNFTAEGEAEQVQKIVKSLGISGNKKFLPLIYEAIQDWNGSEKAKAFRASLPPPVRFLW